MRIVRLSVVAGLLVIAGAAPGVAANYYVRATVGDDANDGSSPEKAWQSVGRLSSVMKAGDTAYVGPGLYRGTVEVENEGTVTDRVIFVGDPTGQHTGDPPGAVMIAGSDPVDESIFQPDASPGTYTATLPKRVWGVVEMDGLQYRYQNTL